MSGRDIEVLSESFKAGFSDGVYGPQEKNKSQKYHSSSVDWLCGWVKGNSLKDLIATSKQNASSENRERNPMSMTSDLIKIIEFGFKNNQFKLNSQPIVPLKTTSEYYEYEIFLATENGVLTGEDGLAIKIPLDVIIEVLERNERSIVMDEFVIKNVIKHVDAMPESLNPSNFHVNLSGKSLNSELFMSRILSWIENRKMSKNKISFELTETACIEFLKPVADFIIKAQSYGCDFSLDDFGKGYSSFNYLINLPISRIKIDGYYIKKMQDNKKAMAIVKSLVYLAKELNIKTVAECIEDKAQYKIAKAIGVDYGQGWFFSKPSSLESTCLSIPNIKYPLSDVVAL